jgi:FMN phosphatase YigB (HAD superfamily)
VRIRAVAFDVGETLVNEERYWREVARITGIEPLALMAALGATIERGAEHSSVYDLLGITRPDAVDDVVYETADLYPDVLPCLEALKADGYLLALAGNQTAALEAWTRAALLPVDVIGSSASWGVRKPQLAFFERMVAELGLSPGEIVYVGDRLDNDVVPAAGGGLVAIHLRRGPWGRLQREGADRAARTIESLLDLPGALRSLP